MLWLTVRKLTFSLRAASAADLEEHLLKDDKPSNQTTFSRPLSEIANYFQKMRDDASTSS